MLRGAASGKLHLYIEIMITKENLEEVLTNIGNDEISDALNQDGDFALIELHMFNTGAVSTIKSLYYDEDIELSAADNGDLFLDKSDLIMLMQQFPELTFNTQNLTMKKVIIKTKSNFRNLNGSIQEVYEVSGTRVTCLIFVNKFQKAVHTDFHITEVTFI